LVEVFAISTNGDVLAREQQKDRRVQRTERLLRDALGSLIHEKSYDSIAVRHILERANVGRSAFYAHFPDKDALLVAGIRQMLSELPSRPLGPSTHRFAAFVSFSHGLLEHIDSVRHISPAMKSKKGRAIVHHHLRQVLLDTVADAFRRRALPGENRVAPELLAEYVVGTFLLVLNWWVESGSALSPTEADDVFLSLVLPTLATTGETR
jgi:AcrR family transcriptional regulator